MVEHRWTPQFFGSGTTIVRHHDITAHLYIYADSTIDEETNDRNRQKMCQEISDHLNDGLRPIWLDDFHRIKEHKLEALSGASITAVGPWVDVDPPHCNWRQDESEDAKDARARLIDLLTGVQTDD